MGQLAIQGGLGEYAKQQQQFGLQQAQLANQAAQAAADRQAQMAQHWQSLQAQSFQNAQNNAQQLMSQQMHWNQQQGQQNAIDNRLDQRQAWQWQQDGSDSLEKNVAAQQAAMSKLAAKMTPDGIGKYRDLSTKLRAIQATRAGTPPQMYAQALAKWQDEFDRSGVADMVNDTPSMDDWQKENYFGPRDESGLPQGVRFYRQPDGKVQAIQDKPDKAAPPKTESPPEVKGGFYNDPVKGWVPAPPHLLKDPTADAAKAKAAQDQKDAAEFIKTRMHMIQVEKANKPVGDETAARDIPDQEVLDTMLRARQAVKLLHDTPEVEQMRQHLQQTNPELLQQFEAATPMDRHKAAMQAFKVTQQAYDKFVSPQRRVSAQQANLGQQAPPEPPAQEQPPVQEQPVQAVTPVVQPAPHGQRVRQNGRVFEWNGQKYVEVTGA